MWIVWVGLGLVLLSDIALSAGNGYGKPPMAAASVELVQPPAGENLEQRADKFFSKEDGVNAALGAALTATLSSHPGVVLVGGFAGIWLGEKNISSCDCEPIELGEKNSGLFRNVSKTIFKGGRAFGAKAKSMAQKTASAMKKLSPKSAALPVPEVPIEPTGDAVQAVAKPVNTEPQVVLEWQAPKDKPKKLIKAPQAAKKMQAAVIVPAKPKAPPKMAKVNKTKSTMLSTAPPKKKKSVSISDVETLPKKDRVLKASSKVLVPMPKVDQNPEVELAMEVQLQIEKMNRQEPAKKPEMKSSKPIVISIGDGPNESRVSEKSTVAYSGQMDCEQQGRSMGRGRLAWLECYYRMSGE